MAERVSGEVPVVGGTLKASILPGDKRNQLGSVEFSGVTVEPAGLLEELGQALAGCMIDHAPSKIEETIAKHGGAVKGPGPGDFYMALNLAFMKIRLSSSSAPDPNAWKKKE